MVCCDVGLVMEYVISLVPTQEDKEHSEQLTKESWEVSARMKRERRLRDEQTADKGTRSSPSEVQGVDTTL